MPTQQQMKEFLQSKGKWDDTFNRPANDAGKALYDDGGKWQGPVPDYDRAEQVKADANKIPLTEEAWKIANAIADFPAPVTDPAKWQEEFITRAARLDFEITWGDNGRVTVYQKASDLLPRLPHLQFLDAGSAQLWLAKEERELAIRNANAKTVGGQPSVAVTQSLDFQPVQQPVSRDEFNELLNKFGLLSAQNAQILEMLNERASRRKK